MALMTEKLLLKWIPTEFKRNMCGGKLAKKLRKKNILH